jgi:hypothetical protein
MPITINGSGTVTGISAGGLPDGVITTDDIAADAVTSAKIASGAIVNADVNASAAIADSKLTGATCKAWVNFNGTGTVAIRASYNVSSITDNGTGDYTVNFTTAMADANYSANVSVTSNGSVNTSTNAVCVFAQSTNTTTTPTASGFRMFVYHPGNQAAQDLSFVTAAIFR